MKPARVKLDDIVKGNTWSGFPEVNLNIDGVPPPSALAEVTMVFRQATNPFGDVKTLTSTVSAEIEILNSAAWTYTVKPVAIDFAPGDYTFSITTRSVAGDVKTYVIGFVTVLRR